MRRFFSFRCAFTSESWTDLDGTDIAFELEAGALEIPMVGSYPLLTIKIGLSRDLKQTYNAAAIA